METVQTAAPAGDQDQRSEIGLQQAPGSPAAAAEVAPVKCAKCKEVEADSECWDCVASFCLPCWEVCHEWGGNKVHVKHAIKKPTTPCEGAGIGACEEDEGERAGANAYCGDCDQALCFTCWGRVHCKGIRAGHQQLLPLARAAFVEEQKASQQAAKKGGPLASLANFDPRKAPPWVGQVIASRKQFDHARRAGLGITTSSTSGGSARASAGTGRYTSIQSQAPQAHAEQLQKICSESGSAAYSDVCIKAYAADRHADVNTIAGVLETVTKKPQQLPTSETKHCVIKWQSSSLPSNRPWQWAPRLA
jgi:hypothetical protein